MIIDPATVSAILKESEDWHLIANICIGYPEAAQCELELQRAGLQDRGHLVSFLFRG